MSNEFQPNWSESDSWDEFRWEQALKYSERMTARYFRLLERFGDLPDAEEFIARKLGDQNLFYFDDEFARELGPDGKPPDASAMDEPDEDDHIGPGDVFYYETCLVYQCARRLALGWCNVLASVLDQEDRFWGMKILFSMGRIISYLAMSIGDGTFERLDGSVAFAKRVMQQVNFILGEINQKTRERPRYHGMFKRIRKLLLETLDLVTSYLDDLRKRKPGGFGQSNHH